MTWAWIDTSSALIGSSQTIDLGLHGECPGDADALPLAAAELVRIALDEGGIETDQVEQLGHASLAGLALGEVVDAQRLGEDLADRLPWVQARVRVLEDHLEAPTPASEVVALERQEVDATEVDRAGLRLGDPDDRPADRGLARAQFADQAERLAAVDRERHAVDRADPARSSAHDAGQDREVDLQVLDCQKRAGGRRCGGRGGGRIRRPVRGRERGAHSGSAAVAAASRASTTAAGGGAGNETGRQRLAGDRLVPRRLVVTGHAMARHRRILEPFTACDHERRCIRPAASQAPAAARRERTALESRGEIGRRALDRGQRRLPRTIEAGERTQEADRVGMGRVGKERLGRSELDQSPRVHDRKPVGETGHDAQVVGDDQDGHPELCPKPPQQVQDLGLDRHIERGRRLVGDEQAGLAAEGHGDHRPLPHPAAELVRVVVDPRRPHSGCRPAPEARRPASWLPCC